MGNPTKDTIAQVLASGGLGAAFIAVFRRLFAVQRFTLRFVDERVEKELADLRAQVLSVERIEATAARLGDRVAALEARVPDADERQRRLDVLEREVARMQGFLRRE